VGLTRNGLRLVPGYIDLEVAITWKKKGFDAIAKDLKFLSF